MLSARNNPFEVDRVERLLTFDPVWLKLSWVEILERAAAMNYRGTVVGAHGSGKTTFCDAFALRLETAGFRVVRWFLNDAKTAPDADELAALDSVDRREATILLLDGAEFLKKAAWKKLCRLADDLAGLFVTIHEEHALPKPRLPVFLRTEAQPEMLLTFARRLAPNSHWDEAELLTVFQQCRGNLREALWCLYDRAASRPGGDQDSI